MNVYILTSYNQDMCYHFQGKGKKKAGGQSGTAATPTAGTAAGTAASSQQPSGSQQSLSPRKR